MPDLAISPSRQTYRVVRREGEVTVIRFASPGCAEDIVFRDGLVPDHPSSD
ncbi:hypothetical protein [Actinomadura sp. SCN-SB]|uniref:hypothetical protein n=1 Tax=Actinomadura sp. SCN-SB TaxID=3373092 RepID=UPI0037514728